jgi:hypothetical protein
MHSVCDGKTLGKECVLKCSISGNDGVPSVDLISENSNAKRFYR